MAVVVSALGARPCTRGDGAGSRRPCGLSREHCQLLRIGSEAVVEDLSTYGTWLNGERVRRRSRLRVGDVLRLGVPGVELALLAVQSTAPGEPLASSVPVALDRN